MYYIIINRDDPPYRLIGPFDTDEEALRSGKEHIVGHKWCASGLMPPNMCETAERHHKEWLETVRKEIDHRHGDG